MKQLIQILGAEHSLDQVAQAIHLSAVERQPALVGAMHITCADESENECATAFQHGFVNFLVPALKFAQRAPFRLSNLGGRYDWGAVMIAEAHYAAGAAASAAPKLLVVKVNAHVGVDDSGEAPLFGTMRRYSAESECCGALHAMLRGEHLPAAEELRRLFVAESPDRLAGLLDENRIGRSRRYLHAALLSARLQARQVILDVQEHEPVSPTDYLVVPCVTLNREGRDTEVVCGYYLAEAGSTGEPAYHGLGDDPTAYALDWANGRMQVSDEHLEGPRQARDHRMLVLEEWHRRIDRRKVTIAEERMRAIRSEAAREGDVPHQRTKAMLKLLLALLADLDPVSAAVFLFAGGATGIHHAFRMHRLVRDLESSHEAKRILEELRARVDSLEPEQAAAMMEVLSREYSL